MKEKVMSESVKSMIDGLKKMENADRNVYLDWVYDQYFNPWESPQERLRAIAILEMYERGELVKIEDDDEY